MSYAYLQKFRAVQWLNREVKSVFFIALLAFTTLATSCFGLELMYYTMIWLLAVYILVCSEDLHPLVPVLTFLYFSPSVQNNPGKNPDSIYYPENGLIYIIVLIVTFVAAFMIRVIMDVKRGNIKVKMPKLTVGFITLGAAYLLGGIGYSDYTPKTILFGLIQIASLCLLYFLFTCFLNWERVPRDYFIWVLFFGGVIISFEVISVYAFNRIFYDGELIRGNIYAGWGMYNNVGAALDMCLPACFYFAAKKKYGVLFLFAAGAEYLCVILTQSRTSIAVGTGLFFACSLYCLIATKGKRRFVNLAVVFVYGVLFLFFVRTFADEVKELLEALLYFEETGSGRLETYAEGIELFRQYPVFGTGFYSCDFYRWGIGEDSFIPARWHNTYVQLLASCGIVGLLAYLFHRAQTLIVLLKRPSAEKWIVFFCVLALVMTSWLDCHFFNIGPGLVYSVMLAFAENARNCADRET